MKRLSLLIVFMVLSLGVAAQTTLAEKLLPTDSTYITGTLDNGMRYYIRHNDKPKGMADFYIARSVGAIEEDDNQDGLAHFLEHMAFNGTKNLPGKAMLNYLQTIGAEFGRNINASTSQEETIYMLNDIPLRRQAIIDSALLILHDWSQDISLLPEEVDKERGVILEELRARNTAYLRVQEKSTPYIYNGTKYKDRLIIGTEEGLKNFKQEDIISFYKEWYRPEYQAIIVVGDFDVEKMENDIIEIFSKIESPQGVRNKHREVIPEYKEDTFVVITDPELQSTSVQYIIPFKEVKPEEENYYKTKIEDYIEDIIMYSMGERLADITLESDPPFSDAFAAHIALVITTEAMYGIAEVKEGDAARGLEVLIAQIEKMRKYGITQDEFDRNLLRLKTSIDANLQKAGDRKSKDYVQNALDNFLYNYSIISPEQEMEIFEEISRHFTLDMVNSFVENVYPDKKGVIIATSPQKEGAVPTVEELKKAFTAGKEANLAAPENSTIAESLITSNITSGSIVQESRDKFGSIVWDLSNGAKIVLHPSDLKKDRIIFSGSGYGGSSYVEQKDLAASTFMIHVANASGIGELSASDLQKYMAGKRGTASLSLTSNRSNVSGSSSSKLSDIETMLQQLYLRFTEPRFDNTALENYIKGEKDMLLNYDKDPSNVLDDKLIDLVFGDHPRIIKMKDMANYLDDITLEQNEAIYKNIFDGVGGYTFFMTGDFAPNEVRPLVEKYIASLPEGEKRRERDDKLYFEKGEKSDSFKIKMENPQSNVHVYYNGMGMDYNVKNILTMKMLDELLDLRYTEIIREEKGATYGVSVSGSINSEPKENFSLFVKFYTNDDVADEMADIVEDEIAKIASGEINDEDLHKVVVARIKNHEIELKEISDWHSWIVDYHKTGEDFANDYIEVLKSITKKDISKIAAKVLKKGNRKRMIMFPEE